MLIYSVKLITIAICICYLYITKFYLKKDKKTIIKYRRAIISIFFMLQIGNIIIEKFNFYYKLNSILSAIAMCIIIILYNKKHKKRNICILSLYIGLFIIDLFLQEINTHIYLQYMCNLLILLIVLHKDMYFYNKRIYLRYKEKKAEFKRLKVTTKVYKTKLDTLKSINKNKEEKINRESQNFKNILSSLNKKVYFIDQSLTNVYEYVFQEKKLYKINAFNEFLSDEVLSNYIFLEKIYNLLYDCKEDSEDSIDIKKNKNQVCNYRIISNILLNDKIGILLIKKNLNYKQSIKEKYEQNHNEFKNIIDHMPYDIILEKNDKIIYQNRKLDYEDNLKKIILDKNIIGNITYSSKDLDQKDIYIKRALFENKNENLIILEYLSEQNSLIKKMNLAKQKYESFVDIILEGVIILDKDTKNIKYTNKSLNKILEKYKLSYTEIYNLIEASSLNYCELSFNMQFEEKKIKNYLNENIYFQFANMVFNINDKNIIIGVFRDITESKKEAILKNKIEEESHNKKIKNEFLINLSHELKTPVNLMYLKNQLTKSLCEKNNIVNFKKIDMLNKELKNIKILINLVDNIIALEKFNLDFYQDKKDYYNIVEILENIVINLNEYEDINIIFDTNKEEIFAFVDYYNLVIVVTRLLSIVSKSLNNKGFINFDIKQINREINIHIYSKDEINSNIKEGEIVVIQTSILLCRMILDLYGGKLTIEKEFNNINIKLKCQNIKRYSYNKVSLTEDNLIKQEFQKIYDL